jgi:hypothetical protein
MFENVDASLYKYLAELTPVGVRVFEDVISEDFDAATQWVVIDTLSDAAGDQPKQNYFLHIAQQKGAPNSKSILNKLVGAVYSIVDEGSVLPLYDVETELEIGQMRVANCTVSPMMIHKAGGSMRTISLGIVYPAH